MQHCITCSRSALRLDLMIAVLCSMCNAAPASMRIGGRPERCLLGCGSGRNEWHHHLQCAGLRSSADAETPNNHQRWTWWCVSEVSVVVARTWIAPQMVETAVWHDAVSQSTQVARVALDAGRLGESGFGALRARNRALARRDPHACVGPRKCSTARSRASARREGRDAILWLVAVPIFRMFCLCGLRQDASHRCCSTVSHREKYLTCLVASGKGSGRVNKAAWLRGPASECPRERGSSTLWTDVELFGI